MLAATEVRTHVLAIIEDVALDDDVSQLKDSVALRDQLDLDSMDFLDIVMELKKRHQIDVPKEDYGRLESMDSCVEYLTPKFNQ
jgi:acyl carrier protein